MEIQEPPASSTPTQQYPRRAGKAPKRREDPQKQQKGEKRERRERGRVDEFRELLLKKLKEYGLTD